MWFVDGGLPGDLVVAHVERDRGRWIEARAAEVLSPSPERRSAPCPLQSRCGGCPWMALEETAQRRWKHRLVTDALTRIGGLPRVAVDEVVEGQALGYRNRVEFTLGAAPDGVPVIGLHAADGSGLVDVDRCLLQHEAANAVLTTLRGVLGGMRPDLPPADRAGDLPRVVLRRSESTGEILVLFREASGRIAGAEAIAAALLDAHPDVVGVVRVRGRAGRRGGATTERLAGRDWLAESVARLELRIPATSFTQVNPLLGATLLEHVVERAGDVSGARVLDLYGGVGAAGLLLAGTARSVVICDADGAAIAAGRAAAAHRPGIEFVADDVASFVTRLAARGRRAEVVLANPPRAGLGERVSRAVAALDPSRVVIVSCDPATLARDARVLVDAGYDLQRVTPFDLFPQTPHVEALALFVRLTGSARRRSPRAGSPRRAAD